MEKIIKRTPWLFLVAILIFGCVGCSSKVKNEETPQISETPKTSEPIETAQAIQTTPIVTMMIKDYGTVTLELYPEMAPNTVNNFITLANSGFYDGLTFHRIIKDFMLQGGDPDGVGTGGPGYCIPGEFINNNFAANTLLHTKGVISMARTIAPDSAGSQFFIMSADAPHLDGNYAAFGKVIKGIEIIETLEAVPVDETDKPVDDVIIESIRVETNGVDVPPIVKLEE